MADQMLQQPVTQTSTQNTPDQVRVFAMPARYRHGAVVNMVEPVKASAPTAIVQPPVPPKVLAPIPSALPQKQQPSQTKKGLLVAGVIVLIALGIGGYLLWRSVQKNKEAIPVEQPSQTQTTSETPAITPATPVTTPVTTGTVPSTNPFPSAVTPGVDTDSDGLTDIEETIVYGTNPNLPDTDGDGFLDGNEVFHGYNPNGTAPGTLELAGLAQMLKIDGIQMLYPMKWTVLPASSGTGSVVSTTTGESVTVSILAKDASLSLSDWYQQSGKAGAPSSSKSRKGYPMLVDKNQLGVYLDLGTQVVSLIYDTSTKATIDYLQTFQMMVNSVEKI